MADYVDFYSSIEHATNLGRLFRPDADPLLPNWRHLPWRTTAAPARWWCRAPRCPGRPASGVGDGVAFGPSERLDIELEVGTVIGVPSTPGRAVAAEAAMDHVFGVVLVNDWSARDIQAWEYQPLGPFLGKSFATTMSAWVTPLAALRACRTAGPVQDPPPLPTCGSPTTGRSTCACPSTCGRPVRRGRDRQPDVVRGLYGGCRSRSHT